MVCRGEVQNRLHGRLDAGKKEISLMNVGGPVVSKGGVVDLIWGTSTKNVEGRPRGCNVIKKGCPLRG